MTPRHHPPEELLLAYAGGSASEGVGLGIATHLALCPRCRREVELLEELGGAEIDAREAVTLPSTGLNRLMMALDDLFAPLPPPLRPAGPACMPEPLRSLVGPIDTGRWKAVIPGVAWSIDLALSEGAPPVRLTKMRGGFQVPEHTHSGTELNLVLAGGFHDRGLDFEPGDMAVNDEEVTHHLSIDRGEPCVMLVVNDAPLVPVGPWSKIVGALTGGY